MKFTIENYSGNAGEIDIDGTMFSIPVGRHQITVDESMQMNPGESMIAWDPNGGMYMDVMDRDDVLTVDMNGQPVFHQITVAAESSGGTLIPIEVFFDGFVFGGVAAATVMMIVSVKKTLMQGPTYD